MHGYTVYIMHIISDLPTLDGVMIFLNGYIKILLNIKIIQLLLLKLQGIGIDGCTLRWFRSFIYDQNQTDIL